MTDKQTDKATPTPCSIYWQLKNTRITDILLLASIYYKCLKQQYGVKNTPNKLYQNQVILFYN